MRLVQTLVVRDEVDVVGEQLAYHLAAGVDFVIATDNGSEDGTLELLERYEREGRLRLLREQGPIRDGPWRTRMARLAATEHGADWVINTDADEFWVPRRGTLKQAFAAVPPAFGVIWAVTRHFVPRPDDERLFWERMTVRFASAGAALNDPTSPYRPHGKAAHRGDPEIVVRYGSHRVTTRLRPLPYWHPADVLHFPYRSVEQYERKTVRRAHSDSRLAQYVRGFQAHERGRVADAFGGLVVDDATLTRGLAAGSLAEDTRLRDALRGSGEGAGADGLATGVAVDAQAFREAEMVRLVRFVDDLGARVEVVEQRARVPRP